MSELNPRLDNDAFIRAVAAHGREYLLWELDARFAVSKLGFVDVVRELGIEDKPLSEQVDVYVGDLDLWFEMMGEQELYLPWLEHAEQAYGGLVDEILDHFDSLEDPRQSNRDTDTDDSS